MRQVPVEKVVYQDRTLEVPVDRIVERKNEVAVRVEDTVYEDKLIEVLLSVYEHAKAANYLKGGEI